MPQRREQLVNWLNRQCQLQDFNLTRASADASFRRYFRLNFADGKTLIAMDAPPEKENCIPFVNVTARLSKTGIHVPEIVEQDLQQGFILLEDLGEKVFLDELNDNSVDELYKSAIEALLQLQLKGDVSALPEYNEKLLMSEMSLFEGWLLQKHLAIELDEKQQQDLLVVKAALVESALAQPKTLVHRDFHSRNLLQTKHNSPGVIDYQDAVNGPLTYDLVSLLRDCYVSWPLEKVDHWVAAYTEKALEQGLIDAAQKPQVLSWFDLMGAQRHLKAAGIFARLNHRDGKDGYLNDIPRTLSYIVEIAARQPVLKPLAMIIEKQVLPAL